MRRSILTVDVEDWRQSTLDNRHPISARVLDNTQRILDLLESARVRATFFVLGLVAERFPLLVQDIARRGHEVASHGTSHVSVAALGPARFREDLRRSIKVIEDTAGVKVLGFRAPDFSIGLDALWALEILSEEGLRYDSSIFPFRGPRYGVPEAFRAPCRVWCRSNVRFVEFPLATFALFGLRLPIAGGGYFRLLPYGLTRFALGRAMRTVGPITFYFHPYEVDSEELKRGSPDVPAILRISQGLGRRRVADRLGRLLHDFSWGPVKEMLDDEGIVAGRRLDLRDLPAGPPRWELE